jgi:putative endonuclease
MYFVYIIKSLKDHKLYIGFTNNFERRLAQHNRGSKATPSTINRGPFVLLYKEEAENRELARKREKYFKTGAGRRFLKKFNIN